MLKNVLNDNRGSAQNWILAIAFIFIIGVGIYAILFRNILPKTPAQKQTQQQQQQQAQQETSGEHQALTVSDVVKRPNIYDFKKVILLRTQLKAWVTDKSFTVVDLPRTTSSGGISLAPKSSNSSSTGTPLLVMQRVPFQLPEHAESGSLALGEERKALKLEGTIRYLDFAAFDSSYGLKFSENDQKALKSYINKPVLVIDAIEVLKPASTPTK